MRAVLAHNVGVRALRKLLEQQQATRLRRRWGSRACTRSGRVRCAVVGSGNLERPHHVDTSNAQYTGIDMCIVASNASAPRAVGCIGQEHAVFHLENQHNYNQVHASVHVSYRYL